MTISDRNSRRCSTKLRRNTRGDRILYRLFQSPLQVEHGIGQNCFGQPSMSDKQMTPDDDLTSARLKTINQRGYLLQLAIARLVTDANKRVASPDRWTVEAKEHSWMDPTTDQEEYIDLVLSRNWIRIVIECKRSGMDASKEWIFLNPTPDYDVDRLHAYQARIRKQDDDRWGWYQARVAPGSHESAFCLLPGQGDDSRTLLERTAGILLRSVEALAKQDVTRGEATTPMAITYFPVVVTNARLCIATFYDGNIDLATATLPKGKVEFAEVPFMRFRKNLSSTIPATPETKTIGEANKAADRTVLVVNSLAFETFLRSLDLG